MPLVRIKSDARAREKPCVRCCYSLRNLGDARHCPECGLSVWVSLNGNDTVNWSKPDWLKKLCAAAAVMGISQLLGLVVYILYIASFGSSSRGEALLAIIGGGYLAGYSAGLLLLGTPEARYPDRWKSFRFSANALGIMGILFTIAVLASFLHDFGWSRLSDGSVWEVAAVLIATAGAMAAWSYLAKLAGRLPSTAAARSCKYLLICQFVWLIGLFQWVGCLSQTDATWIIKYSPLLYLPFTAAFLIWFSVAFNRAAKSAEANWKSETAHGA